jgi:hypothetical protein
MAITDLFAGSLKRKDDSANSAMASEIIKRGRSDLISDLVENLKNEDKNISGDCIEVLCAVGEHGSAHMIAPYLGVFAGLLASGDYRMSRGAMIAIETVTLEEPEGVYGLLPLIIKIMEEGSQELNDYGIAILAKLSSLRDYEKKTFRFLLNQLHRCPVKQLPFYAEKSLVAINRDNRHEFGAVIEVRMAETESNSQRRKLEKIIRAVKTYNFTTRNH